jgi:glycosyltransferase involved in cell wall biosynthesis
MGRLQVSTILAVYNGAATVARALDSAVCQRFQGDSEIVVVDDGSTDSTPDVLGAYGGRIKVLRQPNRGLAAARNAGVAAADGDILAFLDADDVWKPEHLAKTVAPMLTDPGIVLVFSDLIPVDENGVELAAGYVRQGAAHAPSMKELLERGGRFCPAP